MFLDLLSNNNKFRKRKDMKMKVRNLNQGEYDAIDGRGILGARNREKNTV